MYFAVNIHLYDGLEALQGLQQVALVAIVLTVGYLLLSKKKPADNIKSLLWGLAAIWTVASVIVYGYNLHNYLSSYRPLYEKENLQQNRSKY